ncbi:alpha/beta fold hydrolase [Pseudonocardia sp. WMMC193]|uniref:alpha/beta fold hydrolase n=1 Tax=Pseudonocardia sp. WMMC193 TaxID=2911965 RepID=UPI001F1AD2E9|nr:alpha/beta fold hydrolase [Pseudonocardia sp. WMMC193]MCF7550886.1 alpha/beta fold hydrolase [Pseudonocardia sp. WMMC193]
MTAATDTELVERTVDVGGIHTRYLEAGRGDRTVVLLHGSGPGVSARANWRLTMPALAERYRVLAPEMVGYGASRGPADIVYGVRTWVDHVTAFLDAVDVPRAAFVGNSMGGLVSLHIAIGRPDRVERMVLMGSPGIGMRPTEGLSAVRDYDPSPENMRTLLTTYFAHDPSIVDDDLVRARYEASVAGDAHEVYRSMFFDPRHSGNDLQLDADEVRTVRVPTLLVHGLHDKVVPVDVSWTMAGLLPDADLHVFGHCGHWTQIERADEFARLVGGFLSRGDHESEGAAR